MSTVKKNTGETTVADPNALVDNSLAAQTSAPADYKAQTQQKHIDAALAALDDLIDRVGQDVASGIQHENRAVRVGAANLRNVLDGLLGARRVVEAAAAPAGVQVVSS